MPILTRQVKLPMDAKERVERVLKYHQLSKHTRETVAAAPRFLDLLEPPSPHRDFPDHPKVQLPTIQLELSCDALEVLRRGAESLPQGMKRPPQELETLATWLALAGGIRPDQPLGATSLRTCPSAGGLYPCEIYVAAFAIEGLEPGLYHFSPRGFHLRKLRDGPETLARIKRGRPDLQFIKTTPGAILVSTIFWRSVWKYENRGYRYALLDAGHMIENVVACASGLGIPLMTRLRLNDNAMGELIGLRPDAPMGEAEAVQAMLIWADQADHPMPLPSGPPNPMPVIDRDPLSEEVRSYPDVLAVQKDCVAQAIGDIRPPHTDLSVVGANFSKIAIASDVESSGVPLRRVLESRQSARRFARQPITREQLAEINCIAFRTGTFSPLRPEGPHVAMVRAFWLVQNVVGMQKGIWVYDPIEDAWALIKEGDSRAAARTLSIDQDFCAQAAAVCFMAANLQKLMGHNGADPYRLAHLEAGIASQRIYLATGAMGMGCCGVGAFYDDEIRKFLGLFETGWEIIFGAAVGYA